MAAFENEFIRTPVETETAEESRGLDYNSVCHDRVEPNIQTAARVNDIMDVHELLRSNDELVRTASDAFNSIMTKFDRLPDSYKTELLASFAPHMYNDAQNYPMYNRLMQTQTA